MRTETWQALHSRMNNATSADSLCLENSALAGNYFIKKCARLIYVVDKL